MSEPQEPHISERSPEHGCFVGCMELLSQWNRGIAPTDSHLGISLQGRLDLSQVSLMGHSRGGEGGRAAYAQYNDPGSIWPARIVDPVTFYRIFEIAPSNWANRTLNADNVTWAVLLPMCDGDVLYLEGLKPFDRMLATAREDRPTMKATFTVWGANHNFFNSEWQLPDGYNGCIGAGNIPLFVTDLSDTGSAAQRSVAHDAMLDFFLAEPTTFDPTNPVLASISTITRVDRGYSPSADPSLTKRLEDFVNPVGTSTYGLANDASGIEMFHELVWQHDENLQAARIEWESGGADTYFQTNFAEVDGGFDLRDYAYLDLRVDRVADLQDDDPNRERLNPPDGSTDFSVALVDDANDVSSSVPISRYLSLTGPAGVEPWQTRAALQTARIPLASFCLSRLGAVRGVRFTFDKSPTGAIFLANVRATRTVCGAALKQPAPPPAPPTSTFATRPGVSTASSRKTVPARVVRLSATKIATTVPGGFDLKIWSDTRFPARDAMPVLAVGDTLVRVWRHDDPADFRSITFTLSRAQFQGLHGGEPMTVYYGWRGVGIEWDAGKLDKKLLGK